MPLMEANQGGTSNLQCLVASETLAMASAQTETVVLPTDGAVSPLLIALVEEEHAVVEMLVTVFVRTGLFAALLMAGVAPVRSIVGPRIKVATLARILLQLLRRLGRVAVGPAGTASVQMVSVALNMDGVVLAKPTVLVPMTLQPLSKMNQQTELLLPPPQVEPAIHPHPFQIFLEHVVEVLAGTVCVLMELVALNMDGAAHLLPIVLVTSHHLAAMVTQGIPPQTSISMPLRRL
jgi:hypothetical protein